jgi:hypothetical protein
MEITQPPLRTLRLENVRTECDFGFQDIREVKVLFDEGCTLKMGNLYDCVESRVLRHTEHTGNEYPYLRRPFDVAKNPSAKVQTQYCGLRS